MNLPCDLMKAECVRLTMEHYKATGEVLDVMQAEMRMTMRIDDFHLVVGFENGPEWVVPFDPVANAILQSASAARH